MTLVEVFRQAGIELSEEELASLAADALAEVVPRYPTSDPDGRTRRILADAGFDMSPPKPGEIDRIIRSEALVYTTLLASSLTVTEVAARLGVDASRVRQRIHARTLYAVRVGRGWRLPLWQFTDGGTLPGLGALLSALSTELDPVSVARFVTAANDELLVGGEPVSPAEWLAAGRPVETVAGIARFIEAA